MAKVELPAVCVCVCVCVQVVFDTTQSTAPHALVGHVAELVGLPSDRLAMAKLKLESFEWIRIQDSYQVRITITGINVCGVGRLVSAPITPHWKVLRSRNMHHSAPLYIPYLMASFFDGVKIFRFLPKTLDYSLWFLSKR